MLELIGDEEKMTIQEEEEREWGSLSLLTSERIVVPSILVTHILLFLYKAQRLSSSSSLFSI